MSTTSGRECRDHLCTIMSVQMVSIYPSVVVPIKRGFLMLVYRYLSGVVVQTARVRDEMETRDIEA